MALNEADICRRYIAPKLQTAGWDDEPHRINEQVTLTDGRIIVSGRQGRRRSGKRADYILRYRPGMPIAVVEAKPSYATPGQGLQQAKEYAEILGLIFAGFFDLIIVDECHRGSPKDDRNWRAILEYFEPGAEKEMPI